MRVETLTPVVEVAPGGRAHWRLRVGNDSAAAMGYRLRVVGFDAADVRQPPPGPPLTPGSSEELELELMISEAFAAGHHSIAVEVTPDRPGVATVIAAVTVTVGSVDDIALAVVPSTIRARRRATFRVDIDNRSNEPRELELEGDSAELEIRMLPGRVLLQPGERVRTSGRIKGPRHLVGEPRQHSVTVAARSRSAPVYAPAMFQQRSLFPRGLRTVLALLLIVGVWGGALGAAYVWWQSRGSDAEPAGAQLVDTDGDGIPETPGDQLVDTDGDGTPDTLAAVVAQQVAEGGGRQEPPQAGGSDIPKRTSMGGTVTAVDGGEATGVDVTLTPIDLGAPLPEGATHLGFRDGELREVDGPVAAAKFWPARFGRYQPDVRSGFRQTETVPDVTATDERGVWFFGSVSVGQSYEVSFSRPGYDTTSFVVTPSADGKPVDLPVELEPATGTIGGTVSGPDGPLGNVALELTDGTLQFDSASATDGDVGTFTFTGVSTPGTYTLRATAEGLGTEVLQVTLEAGEDRGGVDIGMRAGVGSISGRVTASGRPLGGVRLTASYGDTTVETTSLTEGATGTYLFPRLEIPGDWTIEAELDGYVPQTRLVPLRGDATGIDVALAKQSASIIGVTESSSGGPLPGVNVRVSRDELVFETQSAVAPDPGSFDVRELPPGTYLVELSRYDHEPTSQTVTVGAGEVADLGVLALVVRPSPDIPQEAATLEVRVLDSAGNPISPSPSAPGATVRVFRTADDVLVGEQVGAPDQSSFVFASMAAGTYRIEVTRGATYRLATQQVSVDRSNLSVAVSISLLGQAHGRLVDSIDGRELVDYDVQIRRVNPDDSLSEPVQDLPVNGATAPTRMPDGSLQIRFETTDPPGLASGTYQVTVDDPPPGYRVPGDQVLQPGLPPMRFVIAADHDAPLDLGDIRADRLPELGVARAGSVTGTVLGADGSGALTPLVPPALQVTARRVALEDCVEVAPEPGRPVTAVDEDGDGTLDDFRFSGPPGLYRIELAHPDYQDALSSAPAQESQDSCPIADGGNPPYPNPGLLGPVYRVLDDVDRVLGAPFFTLPVRSSAVTVNVVNDSLSDDTADVGDPVVDAAVELVGTARTFTAVTDGAGEARFDGAEAVPPGAYTVSVTRLDGATFVYFPMRFAVDIAPGGRAVVLDVPLPRIGGVIEGTVGAVNSEGDPVAPPSGIVVTDAHDVLDPVTRNTNATVGTVAEPPPTTATAAPIADSSPPRSEFVLEPVTSGAHTLSFNDVGAPAYRPPSPNPIPVVTVLGPFGVTVDPVDYLAVDRTVEVTVRDAAGEPVDDATVELREPDGDPRPALGAGAAGVYRFADVPPELLPYHVVVSKPLVQTVGPTPLTVAPGDPSVAVAPPVITVRGDLARVTGRVELLQSAGVQVPLTTASSVQLVRAADGVPVGAPVTPDVNGNYTVQHGVPDRYRVRVTGAEFATRESPEIDVVLGRVNPDVDVVVPALATVAVSVTGPPAATVAGRALPAIPSTSVPAPSVAGSLFSFRLDPADTYRFQFTSSAGYVPLTVAVPRPLAPGQTVELAAPMQPRTITGTVAGATAGTSVRAVSGATTIAGSLSGSTYTIAGVPDGNWVVEAAAPGAGRGISADVPVAATIGNVAGLDVTLAPRAVSISFTISPPGASIALGGGPPQAATGGARSIGWPENDVTVEWVATADGHVPQSGTVTLPPSPADPFAPLLGVTVPPITLARPAVTATVAPATGADPVTDAAVFLCPGAVATCAASAAGAVAMPFSDGAYRITPTGPGTWTIGASRSADLAVPVRVDVSNAGVVTPTPPISLALVPPPPPSGP